MNKTFTISFNKDLATVVAKEMRRGKFENTSEFFRHLVRSQFLLDAYPIDAVDAKSSIAKASKRAARTEEFISLSQARHDLSL